MRAPVESSLQGIASYVEDDVALTSYAPPFHCDIKSLPWQTRMIRRRQENYVTIVHGFEDMVSDDIWRGMGVLGWEEPTARQMNLWMEAIMSIEHSRDGFVDLGANVGTHTLYFASRGYNVHAFEPTFANYALLRCSLAISGMAGRVHLNTFGLGDQAKTVCMNSEPKNFGNSKVDPNTTTCQPHLQSNIGTLNTYYHSKLRRQKIAVLKLDVQGYEVAVLHHGQDFFDSEDAPVAVFFEYDAGMISAQGHDPMYVMRYLWQRGYTIWRDTMSGPIGEEHTLRFGKEPLWSGGIDFFAVKTVWKDALEIVGYKFQGGWMLDPALYPPLDSTAVLQPE